ncbi:hypothetical protein [Halarcobacter bivalviorum]|uniref:Uncharacterized protein n=1 Tax=Halarcobacter bivalviorum TaxID=663364 RepID=A0AAX2ACB5_9BACT|nr:hypothetical protein [Halarcobacter bivalviorum]AXH12182.1 hypothetical protein ABIV_1180 [Halarcobacter bivalviorum]RXK11287.1 hypothetical protein CRV05_02665 [Halarcobacter bivalviorum]
MTLVSSNKKTKKLFLTTKTKLSNAIDTKLDIIVSPEFYWVRKFEIPVKTEAQAKDVLPSLFEDITNETSSLTYQVKRLEENLFLCFAFNNKKIYEAIKSSGILVSNIASIYFAQNECVDYKCFKIDGLCFAYVSDNILVKIPNVLIDECVDFVGVIGNIKLSSMRLQIKLYNDLFNTKLLYTFYFIFAVLILLNIARYVDFTLQIEPLEDKIENIKRVNDFPNSMIQANSILNDFEKKIRVEKQKREAISYILTNQRLSLKSFDMQNDEIILEYQTSNKNEVQLFLNKNFKNIKITTVKNLTKVVVKL